MPIGSTPLGQGAEAVEDLLFTCRNHVDPRLGIGIVGIHETIHGSRGLLETSMGQFLVEVSVGC